MSLRRRLIIGQGRRGMRHRARLALAELFGEPDEKSVGPADVAEPIRVFVLHHFAANKLRAPLDEPSERVSSMSSTANMTRR